MNPKEHTRTYLYAMQTLARDTPQFKKNKLHYANIPDLLMQHGKFHESLRLTKKEAQHVWDVFDSMDQPVREQYCFFNAQSLVMNDYTGKIKYVEGYAAYGLPLYHAWCSINDKVVDLTWKDDNDIVIVGEIPPLFAYYGVTFERKDVLRHIGNYEWGNQLINIDYLKQPLNETKITV